jgi:hypothetical protein
MEPVDGLGTLSILPADVRRIVYALPGIPYRVAGLSRRIHEECTSTLKERTRTLGICCRELASYLSYRVECARRAAAAGGREARRPDADGGESEEWQARPIESIAIRYALLSDPCEILDWRVDIHQNSDGTVTAGAMDMAKERLEAGLADRVVPNRTLEWYRLADILQTSVGDVLVERGLGMDVLARRVWKRDSRSYTIEHYERTMRRFMDDVLRPLGYGLEDVLGITLRRDVRVMRLREDALNGYKQMADADLGRVTRAGALFCLMYSVVTREPYTAARLLPVARGGGSRDEMCWVARRTNYLREKARECLLVQSLGGVSRLGRVPDKDHPLTARDLRTLLARSVADKKRYGVHLSFCRLHSTVMFSYSVAVSKKRNVAEKRIRVRNVLEEDEQLEVAWEPLGTSERWQALLALLDGWEDAEVVVSASAGRKVFRNDATYAEVLRDQMRRILPERFKVDALTLLGRSETLSRYRCAQRCFRVVATLPDTGPYTEREVEIIEAFSRLHALLGVLMPKHAALHAINIPPKRMCSVVVEGCERLGMWAMMSLPPPARS